MNLAQLMLYRGQEQRNVTLPAPAKNANNVYQISAKVLKSWGSYEEILSAPEFKVKRMVVKPGAAISLQYHNHRAEHWVIVKGVAKVTNGDEVSILGVDDSAYIPRGTVHRIENISDENLEFIEVQTGKILEEYDIVRLKV